jgi:hypothetical protein
MQTSFSDIQNTDGTIPIYIALNDFCGLQFGIFYF